MRKFASAALAALIGLASVSAAVAPASAGWKAKQAGTGTVYYKQNYRPAPRSNWGAGAGAGFAAGAIVGLGLGAAAAAPAPYYGPYYYYPPPPPPVPVYRPYPAYGWTEAHVEWCVARYRSYNPATNTFIGYDGYAHACVAPY